MNSNLNLSTYMGRLKSFEVHRKKWPHSGSLSAENMAKSGFSFLGTGDAVKCYYCNKELQYWEKDEDPFEEHKAHQTTCPFVEMFSEPPNSITIHEAIKLEIKRTAFIFDKDISNLLQSLNGK